MQIIALTGGIASGKSTVSAHLAERGAVIVDADQLARAVVEPGTGTLASIEMAFGPTVIDEDGSLNRAALGAIVFADEAARLKLNSITHPAVWHLAKQRFAEAEAAGAPVVVYDVPLLVEASDNRPLHFDHVLVITASREERLRRLLDDRGMQPADAVARLDAQASDEERVAVADTVIANDGDRQQLLAAVDEFWASLSE